MQDLISRQAAIEALNKKKIYRPLDSDRWVISDCLNAIVNLPSAQPERKIHFADADHVWIDGKQYISLGRFQEAVVEAQPERKKGKWIHDGYAFKGGIDWMHCSECGHKDSWSVATRTPFCAWCGADMRGEQE